MDFISCGNMHFILFLNLNFLIIPLRSLLLAVIYVLCTKVLSFSIESLILNLNPNKAYICYFIMNKISIWNQWTHFIEFDSSIKITQVNLGLPGLLSLCIYTLKISWNSIGPCVGRAKILCEIERVYSIYILYISLTAIVLPSCSPEISLRCFVLEKLLRFAGLRLVPYWFSCLLTHTLLISLTISQSPIPSNFSSL